MRHEQKKNKVSSVERLYKFLKQIHQNDWLSKISYHHEKI